MWLVVAVVVIAWFFVSWRVFSTVVEVERKDYEAEYGPHSYPGPL